MQTAETDGAARGLQTESILIIAKSHDSNVTWPDIPTGAPKATLTPAADAAERISRFFASFLPESQRKQR